MKHATYVDAACDALQIVGDDLKSHLEREIPAKVLLRQARDVVLIMGPTGVGKEMVASACHEAARLALGRGGDLVEVNCANLGRGLFESELFGYRRGAFTGADRDYQGLAGRAEMGTLVLDEIQCLEPQDQGRLLRFLGEREYRAVGDDKVKSCSALIVLSTNRDLHDMVSRGEFRRDVLDRAAAKLRIPPLHQRRRDIAQLTQEFATQAAAELGAENFYGLTRRASEDVATAIVRAREVSVRRLREIVRNAVFLAAANDLPEVIESDLILPVLQNELGFSTGDRAAQDILELQQDFTYLVSEELKKLSAHHGVSPKALHEMCCAVQNIIDEMGDQPRSYRNVIERANRLAKVALWLVSRARTQAEFRRFFGGLDAEMPTKSVAHQIYYDVFPRNEGT